MFVSIGIFLFSMLRIPSRSSFLLRGSTSTLEGCGVTKTNQRHEGLTLFSGEQTTKVSSHSTKRDPSRRKPEPLHKAWGTTPQLNWRRPRTPRVSTTQRRALKVRSTPRVSNETPRYKFHKGIITKTKLLWRECRSRSSPSIFQVSTRLIG